MSDHTFLMRALDCGGACDVTCPWARTSLLRAGLMEPMPRGSLTNCGYQRPHPMRLTKAGKLRAEELYRQRAKRWPRGDLYKLNRRRYKLMALTKEPATRYANYRSIPQPSGKETA